MKIYNAFGIKPTNTYCSAGSDYYIPNLQNEKQIELAFKAFEKSYNVTKDYIDELYELFTVLGKDYQGQEANLIHLFLALYDPNLSELKEASLSEAVLYFLDEFVVYNGKNIGIKLELNDTLFINSGLKVALDTVLSEKVGPNPSRVVADLRMLGIGIAGLYVNKSGMGNKGWDVRACLVDEDYSGYVHLSMAYTKDVYNTKQNIVYCGDKLTQMMLIPVFHDEYIEVDEFEYNSIMSGSSRGDSGFGSSDVKH